MTLASTGQKRFLLQVGTIQYLLSFDPFREPLTHHKSHKFSVSSWKVPSMELPTEQIVLQCLVFEYAALNSLYERAS